MTDYLLTRAHRKRKREISTRILRQTHDLMESLRDLKELTEELKSFYEHCGDEDSATRCQSLLTAFAKPVPIKMGVHGVDDMAHVLLLRLPEEKH